MGVRLSGVRNRWLSGCSVRAIQDWLCVLGFRALQDPGCRIFVALGVEFKSVKRLDGLEGLGFQIFGSRHQLTVAAVQKARIPRRPEWLVVLFICSSCRTVIMLVANGAPRSKL